MRGAAFAFDVMLVIALTATPIASFGHSVWRLSPMLLAGLFAYFVIGEGWFGTTFGKHLFGMRVVRASDGRRCGPRAALVRTILRLVDNLPLSLPGLIAISSSEQCKRCGDRAAGTLVVVELPEDVLRALYECAPEAPHDLGLAPSGRFVRSDVLWPDPAGGRTGQRLQGGIDLDQCPSCEVAVRLDEVVCPHCGQYINQLTLRGEGEEYAPTLALYMADRRLRFDAVRRLVLAGDEQSLTSVAAAVAGWPIGERQLAVEVFAQVDDSRPLPFLELMTRDDDAAVRALARGIRSSLLARQSPRAG